MRSTIKLALLIGCVGVLAACARNEPEPVTFTPTFNKVGEPECPAGFTLTTDSVGNAVCLDPSSV